MGISLEPSPQTQTSFIFSHPRDPDLLTSIPHQSILQHIGVRSFTSHRARSIISLVLLTTTFTPLLFQGPAFTSRITTDCQTGSLHCVFRSSALLIYITISGFKVIASHLPTKLAVSLQLSTSSWDLTIVLRRQYSSCHNSNHVTSYIIPMMTPHQTTP